MAVTATSGFSAILATRRPRPRHHRGSHSSVSPGASSRPSKVARCGVSEATALGSRCCSTPILSARFANLQVDAPSHSSARIWRLVIAWREFAIPHPQCGHMPRSQPRTLGRVHLVQLTHGSGSDVAGLRDQNPWRENPAAIELVDTDQTHINVAVVCNIPDNADKVFICRVHCDGKANPLSARVCRALLAKKVALLRANQCVYRSGQCAVNNIVEFVEGQA